VTTKKPKTRAPEQTLEEVRYLRQLIQDGTPIRVRLLNNQEFSDVVLTIKGRPII